LEDEDKKYEKEAEEKIVNQTDLQLTLIDLTLIKNSFKWKRDSKCRIQLTLHKAKVVWYCSMLVKLLNLNELS